MGCKPFFRFMGKKCFGLKYGESQYYWDVTSDDGHVPRYDGYYVENPDYMMTKSGLLTFEKIKEEFMNPYKHSNIIVISEFDKSSHQSYIFVKPNRALCRALNPGGEDFFSVTVLRRKHCNDKYKAVADISSRYDRRNNLILGLVLFIADDIGSNYVEIIKFVAHSVFRIIDSKNDYSEYNSRHVVFSENGLLNPEHEIIFNTWINYNESGFKQRSVAIAHGNDFIRRLRGI